MKLRCKVWLERDGEILFGKGRALLLASLKEAGSLAGAARLMNMSYRAAWGKLKASEEHLGVKLVERADSGHHGMTLTAAGDLMLREYEKLMREAEEFFTKREPRFAAGIGRPKAPSLRKATRQLTGKKA